MTENKVRPLASECKSESLFDPLSLVASCGLHWRLSAQPLLAHPAALGALVLVLAMAIGFSLHSLTLSFSLTLSLSLWRRIQLRCGNSKRAVSK